MKTKNSNNKILISIIIYLVIYLGLLFKSGFFFAEQYSRYTSIIYLGLLFVLLLIFNDAIKIKIIIFFGLIFIGMLLNWIISGFPELSYLIFNVVNLLTGVFLCSLLDIKTFNKYFTNLMLVIAIFSIIGFLLMILKLPIYERFPKLINSAGRVGYFCLFTIISDFSFTGATRVQGIFWEPGAFQVFLIIALVIISQEENRKIAFIKEIIISICVVMTFSTTGIICLIIYWIYLLSRKFKHLKLTPYIAMAVLSFGLYFYFQNYATGFMKVTIYDKIQQVLNYSEGVSTASSSRIDSIIYPIKFGFSDPLYLLFGYGENGLAEMTKIVGHKSFTFTPINYLLQYGLIIAALSVLAFVKLLKSFRQSFLDSVVLSVLLLLCVSSENLCMNLIINFYLCHFFVEKEK